MIEAKENLIMRIRFLFYFASLSAVLAAPLCAAPREIGWDDLAPPSEAIDNPFEALSEPQLDKLRKLLRLEASGAAELGAEESKKTRTLRAELFEDGLDADALFAQREEIMSERIRAASAVSEDLVGTDVRVPGYVLPLAFEGDRAVEFLLVPTVGACIHTPPPPANQMIHVRFPEGVVVEGLYTPVWVSGTLAEDRSVQSVIYSDGQSKVSVSYAMQPEEVVLY